MIPSIFTPTSRDWIEDFARENGSYLCRCCYCKETFIGYKRRVVCKSCHDADQAKAKERGEWLAKHNAPADWVIVTMDELRGTRKEYADLLLRFHVEQNLRRKLAAALKVADQTNSNVAYWGHPGRHRDVSQALLADSEKLDEVKS